MVAAFVGVVLLRCSLQVAAFRGYEQANTIDVSGSDGVAWEAERELDDSEELTVGHFHLFDANSDGEVDGLEALRYGPRDAWLHALEQFDASQDGRLSRSEFAALCEYRRGGLENASQALLERQRAADREAAEAEEAQEQERRRRAEAAGAEAAGSALELLSAGGSAAPFNGDLDAVELLHSLFRQADRSGRGLLSLKDYSEGATAARFQQVEGVYRSVVDLDEDGQISAAEAAAAARFEFEALGGGEQGLTFTELHQVFAARGWLRRSVFEAAKRRASVSTLQGLVTAFMDLHYVQPETRGGNVTDGGDAGYDEMDGLPGGGHHKGPTVISSEPEAMALLYKYTLAELTRILSVKFCYRRTYDRGLGRPAKCAAGYEKHGAMCYEPCREGYRRSRADIEFCQKPCDAVAERDLGLFCRTHGRTRRKQKCCRKCWPGNWCCGGYCCGGCGEGFTNTGCFCEPSWSRKKRYYSPGVTKYRKSAVTCSDEAFPDGPKQTPIARFCYPKPRENYQCQLTACQEKCQLGLIPCGVAACAADQWTCGSVIGQMVAGVVMAVGQTVLLAFTFGTSSVATTAVRGATDIAVQEALQATASAMLSTVQTKLATTLAREAIKRTVIESVVKLLIKNAVRFSIHGVVKGAVVSEATGHAYDAIVYEIMKKREADMAKFDFKVLDVTGISTAIVASKDGAHPIVQAQEWLRVVSLVDPTGWVSAGAAFMNPMCDNIAEH